ncbi:MAG: hypothetical protein LBR51_01160, partial [Bacteroidales bacterium]|nr:hypothetical protein [Bacteroidales bacterium]
IKQIAFAGTDLENASMLTIREKILLTAVHIRRMKTKIKIELPAKHPNKEAFAMALQYFEDLRRKAV